MLKNVKTPIFVLACMSLVAVLIGTAIFGISVGAVNIENEWIYKIITNKMTGKLIFEEEWTKSAASIIWNIRFPKVIVAACVGAGLTLAGILMQALTKNPLADPYILGISSGASTGAVAVLLLGASLPILNGISVQLGAFLGALISGTLVFLVSGAGKSAGSTKLVLSGTAIASIFSALTNLIIFKTPDTRKVSSAMFWMTGSFAGIQWNDVLPLILTLLIGIIVCYCIHRTLDTLLLGEEMAITLGVNLKRSKNIIMLTATLLTGVMVSVSGIIGFVGLIVPHISRSIVGSTHKRLVPFSLLLGSIFMILADVAARVWGAPEELPIGVVTAILGAPFFLALLHKSKYSFN